MVAVTYPVLFPAASSQGTWALSFLKGAPLFVNSLEILANNLSSLLLSITGTPSITITLSCPALGSTRYLRQVNRSGQSLVPDLSSRMGKSLCFDISAVDFFILWYTSVNRTHFMLIRRRGSGPKFDEVGVLVSLASL